MIKIKPNEYMTRRLMVFMSAMVLANIGGHMYEPLLPLYLKDLDASVVEIGWFFTIAQIIPLTMQILGGWASDRLGRLRSVAIGSFVGVFAYIPLIFAPSWEWALLGEGLGAITRSLIGPSFMAFIAEESTETNRARVYGFSETLFMVVAVIGPPLGGLLAEGFGFRIMLSVSFLLYILATIIRIAMARSAVRNSEETAEKLTVRGLLVNLRIMVIMLLTGGLFTWILISDGIRDITWTLSFNLMPLYLDEIGGLSLQQIGWLNSIFGLFMMLLTIPSGWLSDKKGERYSIVAGFLFQAIAFFVFVRVSGLIGFYAAAGILGMGFGLMMPAFNSLTSKVVPEKQRGTAFGLLSTSLGIMSLPAPAIGAQLWDKVNPQLPFRITAWLSLFAVIPVWLKFKSPEKEKKRFEEKMESARITNKKQEVS
ncbi:MAG: MFS transporter [Anaerolineales bacterium]|jgi:DHA1 family multidrug resistance protein-like MFS transporter